MNELTNLTFDEVSVVDAGANPEADIVLIKRQKPEQNSPAPAVDTSKLSEVEKSFIKVALQEQLNSRLSPQDTIETLKLNIADLADKVAAHLATQISTINKEAQNMNENEKNTTTETADVQNAEGVNKNSDAPTETNTAPELPAVDVDKNLPKPDAVTVTEEAIEKLNASIAQLTERFNKMQEQAEQAEFVKIAAKYEILGEDTASLAESLKVAKRAGGNLYEKQIQLLDGMLELTKKQGLYDEIGKSGYGSGGTAKTQIEKIAAEIKKNKPELTDRQAIDAAFQAHPELQF